MKLFVSLGMKRTLAIQKLEYCHLYLWRKRSECNLGIDYVVMFANLFKFGRLSFVLCTSLLPKPFSNSFSAILFFLRIKLRWWTLPIIFFFKLYTIWEGFLYYKYEINMSQYFTNYYLVACLSKGKKPLHLYYMFSVSNGNCTGFFKWKIFYDSQQIIPAGPVNFYTYLRTKHS